MGLCGSKNAVGADEDTGRGKRSVEEPKAERVQKNQVSPETAPVSPSRRAQPPVSPSTQAYPLQNKASSPTSNDGHDMLVPVEVAVKVQEEEAPLALQILQHGFGSEGGKGVSRAQFMEKIQELDTARREDKLAWVLSVMFGGATEVTAQTFVNVFSSLSPGSEAPLLELIAPLLEGQEGQQEEDTISVGAISSLLLRVLPKPSMDQLLTIRQAPEPSQVAEGVVVQDLEGEQEDGVREPQAVQGDVCGDQGTYFSGPILRPASEVVCDAF